MGYRVRCAGRIKLTEPYVCIRNGKSRVETTQTCKHRYTLSKHPDEYKILPKCPVCGSRKWSLDKNRRKELAKREKCHCDGYPILSAKGLSHSKGSKNCRYYQEVWPEGRE